MTIPKGVGDRQESLHLAGSAVALLTGEFMAARSGSPNATNGPSLTLKGYSARSVSDAATAVREIAAAPAATAKGALAHGALDYVVKPIDLQYLSRSIEAALLMAQPEL